MYADRTFVQADACTKLSLFPPIGDPITPTWAQRFYRFYKAYYFLNVLKLEKLTSQARLARRDLSNGIKNAKPEVD